jgi:hypothetical protein
MCNCSPRCPSRASRNRPYGASRSSRALSRDDSVPCAMRPCQVSLEGGTGEQLGEVQLLELTCTQTPSRPRPRIRKSPPSDLPSVLPPLPSALLTLGLPSFSPLHTTALSSAAISVILQWLSHTPSARSRPQRLLTTHEETGGAVQGGRLLVESQHCSDRENRTKVCMDS